MIYPSTFLTDVGNANILNGREDHERQARKTVNRRQDQRKCYEYADLQVNFERDARVLLVFARVLDDRNVPRANVLGQGRK